MLSNVQLLVNIAASKLPLMVIKVRKVNGIRQHVFHPVKASENVMEWQEYELDWIIIMSIVMYSFIVSMHASVGLSIVLCLLCPPACTFLLLYIPELSIEE